MLSWKLRRTNALAYLSSSSLTKKKYLIILTLGRDSDLSSAGRDRRVLANGEERALAGLQGPGGDPAVCQERALLVSIKKPFSSLPMILEQSRQWPLL